MTIGSRIRKSRLTSLKYFGCLMKSNLAVYIFLIVSQLSAADTFSRFNEDKPLIFPVPVELNIDSGNFFIDESTFIMLPEKESDTDRFIAGLLFSELADKFEQPVSIVTKASVAGQDKFILTGDLTNPLVKDYCEKNGLIASLKVLGSEGYILKVTPGYIVVASAGQQGVLFGFESLRQIIGRKEGNLLVPCLVVKDSPMYEFRGIKMYLPGKENIQFFKRFVKDFAALYKYNRIILELNANMRLERHPELNTGTVGFKRHLDFSRLGRPPGQHNEFQNSSHQDNADGQILEKYEVAEIVDYIRKFGFEVIPELPSLTHSYYLLFGHEDLAENINQPYPDTYCPLKPEIYKIYFDVLDEYIEVIHPAVMHIGHDEWRMEKDVCELCKGRDYGQLYADDLLKIHDYLASKGIKTAIWGDHLLESVTGKGFRIWKSSTGYEYKIPGALKPEQVISSVPKDVLIFNWFWDDINNDRQLSEFGFRQVYGNLRPDIDKWQERKTITGVMGGAPSSWAATTELNIGKDQLFDFLGCANLLWSPHYFSPQKLAFVTEPLVSGIYGGLSGKVLPSDAGSKVTPLNISSYFNSSLSEGIDSLNVGNLKSGPLTIGNKKFSLALPGGNNDKKGVSVIAIAGNSDPGSVEGIQVGMDVNSLLFLHACAREANNKKAYDEIYNFSETADLLGWYEVMYADGFMETIPLRYGMNILDIQWRQRMMNNTVPRAKFSQSRFAYQASAVDCSTDQSDPVVFFAFEWENPRYGIPIESVNLKSVRKNIDDENAIILLAVSVAEKKRAIEAEGNERQ